MDSKRLERIEEKLDATNEKLASINKTLAEQHVSLKEHVRRTNLLEIAVDILKNQMLMAMGALKFVGWLAVALGAIKIITELK